MPKNNIGLFFWDRHTPFAWKEIRGGKDGKSEKNMSANFNDKDF